jgi:deoxyribodipyrimidine photo-lyase
MEPTIWWIRRDVRLHDNPALARALAGGGPVVPLFVLDPALLGGRHHGVATRRRSFLFAGLRALDDDLRSRGARLVIRTGRPADVLEAFVREAGARGVVAEGDASPYARRRDADVRRAVPLEIVGSTSVHHPAQVVKHDGTPYTVFTPFKNAWLARPLPAASDVLAAPERLPPVPTGIGSEPLPDGETVDAFPAGETEARRRLQAFVKRAIERYATERDRVDHDGTSALSPYFRFGMLSAREAVVAALAAGAGKNGKGSGRKGRGGPDVWLSELVWREFYLAILFHHPHVLSSAFNQRFRRLAYRRSPRDLAAWRSGRTGYPVVDAAMRQLAAIGWMHNRARMIVASFLTKDLLLDWRDGEAWFMERLLDGDPAANNGGWQWTAGVGTDAAPYFRVFSPVLQGKRCDPDGAYVRRWLPELAHVPAASIHEPWTLTPLEQRAARCIIGRDYPAPIVEHHTARERALAAYRDVQAEAR